MSSAAPGTELVCAANNHLGETPLWSVAEQALYWVNCENPPQIHRFKPADKTHAVWPMPQRVGGIALAPHNRLLVVLSHGIFEFAPQSGELQERCASPLPAHVSLHECQCDRQGRLWVGSYDHQFTSTNRDARDGALFRLDGRQLTPVVSNISVANGLAFSTDGRRMYFSDAPTRLIECFDVDPASGELANRATFTRLPDGEGFVDGATVDAQGAYWLATVGAGALRRYLPDGTLERIVALPVSNPTNATFGGKDLDVLYVTTTRLALGPDSNANGGVYALKPGVPGVAEPIAQDPGPLA